MCPGIDSDSDDDSKYEEETHVEYKENYSLLAIAYYNVATQQEFLNKSEDCKASFK